MSKYRFIMVSRHTLQVQFDKLPKGTLHCKVKTRLGAPQVNDNWGFRQFWEDMEAVEVELW